MVLNINQIILWVMNYEVGFESKYLEKNYKYRFYELQMKS